MITEAANDESAHPFAHGTGPEDFARLRAEGNMLTDGGINHQTFVQGWGLPAGNFDRAHYFRRLMVIDIPRPGAMYKPICSDNPDRYFWHTTRWPIFHPGNWTRCAHCVARATKRGLK